MLGKIRLFMYLHKHYINNIKYYINICVQVFIIIYIYIYLKISTFQYIFTFKIIDNN